MKLHSVIYLTKITNTLMANTESYISIKKNLSSFNREGSVLLSNQRPGKNNMNHRKLF